MPNSSNPKKYPLIFKDTLQKLSSPFRSLDEMQIPRETIAAARTLRVKFYSYFRAVERNGSEDERAAVAKVQQDYMLRVKGGADYGTLIFYPRMWDESLEDLQQVLDAESEKLEAVKVQRRALGIPDWVEAEEAQVYIDAGIYWQGSATGHASAQPSGLPAEYTTAARGADAQAQAGPAQAAQGASPSSDGGGGEAGENPELPDTSDLYG